jgi:hypothetical protein
MTTSVCGCPQTDPHTAPPPATREKLQVMIMSILAPEKRSKSPADVPAREIPVRRSARQRRQERRRLAEIDRRNARLTELHAIDALLRDAQALLQVGWVQNSWYSYRDTDGRSRIAAQCLRRVDGDAVTGACLVGAIVHAGGGPAHAHAQLVQRTLDLVWHALHRRQDPYQQWTPPPVVRAAQLRDLTRWNDDRRRSHDQVISLLDDTADLARAQARELQLLG